MWGMIRTAMSHGLLCALRNWIGFRWALCQDPCGFPGLCGRGVIVRFLCKLAYRTLGETAVT